ncbi:M23 family metallopeptidase [Mycetocola spongiae]|nr:M23 family metallopeptidase [Mycetocola spongiae]
MCPTLGSSWFTDFSLPYTQGSTSLTKSPGTPGTTRIPGTTGTPGTTGIAGTPGTSGRTGIPGTPGKAHKPGITGIHTGAGHAGTRWPWPLDPPPRVLREFSAPLTPWGPGHRGLNLEATPGTPVFAPADGTVAFSGFVVDRPVLTISHPGDLRSSYEPLDSPLTEGEPVRRGQLLGVVSTGGQCSERCLYIGLRSGEEYINPRLYFGTPARIVLLPPP